MHVVTPIHAIILGVYSFLCAARFMRILYSGFDTYNFRREEAGVPFQQIQDYCVAKPKAFIQAFPLLPSGI